MRAEALEAPQAVARLLAADVDAFTMRTDELRRNELQ